MDFYVPSTAQLVNFTINLSSLAHVLQDKIGTDTSVYTVLVDKLGIPVSTLVYVPLEVSGTDSHVLTLAVEVEFWML